MIHIERTLGRLLNRIFPPPVFQEPFLLEHARPIKNQVVDVTTDYVTWELPIENTADITIGKFKNKSPS